MGHLRTGKTKPLVILSLNRVAQLPDVRTADEQGIDGFEQPSYLGIMATARTPVAIIIDLSQIRDSELGPFSPSPTGRGLG